MVVAVSSGTELADTAGSCSVLVPEAGVSPRVVKVASRMEIDFLSFDVSRSSVNC